MARIFGTGFEDQDLTDWTLNEGTTISASTGLDMDGNYCLKAINSGSYVKKIFESSYPAIYLAFRVRCTKIVTIIGFFDSAGTLTASLGRNDVTGCFELRRGTYSGTLLQVGTVVRPLSTTYLIEIYYKPLNSGGEITVKVDGNVEITYSGDTTNGLENVKEFRLNYVGLGSSSTGYYDNIVVDDANWIGKTYFQLLTVSEAGTTTQWTPSTGSNYQTVDEVPAVDTDYNSTNTTNNIDTFVTSSLTGTIDTIKGVYLKARAAYEGAPNPAHIQLGVRSGGTDYFATDKSPASSFGPLTKILETDPATSGAWTETNVNAVEIGYKAVA